MVNLLPKFTRAQAFLNYIRDSLLLSTLKNILNKGEFLGLKKKKSSYLVASFLDIILIFLIIFNGIAPAQRLIEPFVTPIQIFEKNIPQDNFAFAPGSSTTKMNQISFANLDTLAFYDIPIDSEGEINTSSRGYINLTSSTGEDLIQKAKSTQTKFLLTITLNQQQSFIKLLNNESSQDILANNLTELLEETSSDGIALAFEPQGNLSSIYRAKYTSLAQKLSSQLKSQGYIFNIVVPTSSTPGSIYDIKELTSISDKLMIIASDFAVPEQRSSSPTSPQYGFSSTEYWNKVGEKTSDITTQIPSEKLSLETAWYGNGNNYPMYVPRTTPAQIDNLNDPDLQLTEEKLDSLVDGVPKKARDAARRNIPYIVEALRQEGILNNNVLAYAMATIEHETASTFEPLEEYSGRFSARRLGYEGGTDYFGRGFIQLTHLRNYKLVGQRIGMGDELVKNPHLAGNPDVAAKVLAAFFRDNNIASLASKGEYIAARRPVNPDANGRKVATLALKYDY